MRGKPTTRDLSGIPSLQPRVPPWVRPGESEHEDIETSSPTGKKTPGGAGTHTGHTGHTGARGHTDHTDEPHNEPPRPNDTPTRPRDGRNRDRLNSRKNSRRPAESTAPRVPVTLNGIGRDLASVGVQDLLIKKEFMKLKSLSIDSPAANHATFSGPRGRVEFQKRATLLLPLERIASHKELVIVPERELPGCSRK